MKDKSFTNVISQLKNEGFQNSKKIKTPPTTEGNRS
jgi:hypothetical protein